MLVQWHTEYKGTQLDAGCEKLAGNTDLMRSSNCIRAPLQSYSIAVAFLNVQTGFMVAYGKISSNIYSTYVIQILGFYWYVHDRNNIR